MKIGIIGMGHVGKAMRQIFAPYAELVEYDLNMDCDYPEQELAECDFAVVCVSTPMRDDYACEVGHVQDAIAQLPVERVLIKSTVAPGTTDRLIEETGKRICFSPEYFGESAYFSSFAAAGPGGAPFVIIGGAQEDRQWMVDALCPIHGPERTYFQCSALEAEVIKYMENSYLATKVTFVNEFYEICKAFGADWHTVREGWLLDPRVEKSHSLVFKENRGFGGRCLPKDVNAIVEAAARAGYEAPLLRAILEVNRKFGGESG